MSALFFVGEMHENCRGSENFCAMLGDGLKNGFMEIFVHNVLFELNLTSKKCKLDFIEVIIYKRDW